MNDHDVSDDSPYNTVHTQALMREISDRSEFELDTRSQHSTLPSVFPEFDDSHELETICDAALIDLQDGSVMDTSHGSLTRSPSI